MNRIVLLLVASVVATGCASSTVIRSDPPGATVFDRRGNQVGVTPYYHSDSETNGHSERFQLELEGHKPRAVVIRRDKMNGGRAAGFGIGGIFFPPAWAGLFWMNDYEPDYTVTLQPDDEADAKTKKVAKSRR